MGQHGNDFLDLLKDAGKNFIAALAITLMAACFALIEKYGAQFSFPEYVGKISHEIGVGLYVIDAIVVVGTAAILGLKLLGTAFIVMWKQLERLWKK